MLFFRQLLFAVPTIFIIFLSAHCQVFAQSDTLKKEYATENSFHSDFSFREKYRYFTRTNVEEKTLIKVGGSVIGGWNSRGRNSIGLGFVGSFINVVAIEQKLLPAISILGAVENTWVSSGKQHNGYAMEGQLGLRWYYSMNKHIREESRANNFSNHYLSLQSNHSLYQTENEYKRNSMLSFLWGIQIRLGKSGYFDANIGPAIKYGKLAPSESRLGYDANLSIGFGF